MRRLWLLAALMAIGCSNPFGIKIPPIPTEYCPSKAVGVFVSYVGEGKNTDEIDFVATIDGQQPETKIYTRTPGGDSETLEIDIDYAANLYNHITVTGVARLKGVYVGSDVETKQIDNDCTNVVLYVGTGGSGCIDTADCRLSSEVCIAGKCCYQSSDGTTSCI